MKKLFSLHYLLVLLVAVSVTQPVFSQKTKFVEKVTKKGNEVVIPYGKYKLANGLTLIIHEDHSDPLVRVKANVTDSSVIEFMKEIKGYNKGGITTEELEFMKQSIGQRDARSYETPFQKASFLNRILTYDPDRNFVKNKRRSLTKSGKKKSML